MSEVVLFHTDGCHLCEQAADLLAQAGQPVKMEDIVTRPEWVEQYGIRIPVVRRADGAELGWPFDLDSLKQFLEDAAV
ncbi:glutaredoxin family protein [Ferrimonas marina]|uniref:Glutaredoxin n=1 Tax=Ferrimonas marina TaxID=299255 RepID=A0A1M5NGV7_9GAMM|nr:glutaredoxin family protein [Ferrimonas marina]SHG88203.1 Glutaredoxin [Ferrimonas marina]